MTTHLPSSVLVLEDEGLVALMLEDLLREMGARAVDCFAAAADALKAATTGHYDCAVLDVIVRDGTSARVADVLHERGIPFVFSSGVGREALELRHQSASLITKPFDDTAFKTHIAAMLKPR
jgi:CheY-like chemotaxis protein